MADTITSVQLVAGNMESVNYYTYTTSTPTQLTNVNLYISSTTATALNIADPKTSTILSIEASVASAAGIVTLLWGASTPVLAWSLPKNSGLTKFCFKEFGGLKNQGGAGRSGNIFITTTGLVAGDSFSLVIKTRPI